MNKEQLLQHFAGLDTSVLQKLYKYSNLLIIPDEDLLTNVTMSQMVEKAHSLADVYFPEWTDRSKSDFGQFLIELFALFSEKDFWYINAFANEGILRKMRSYSNVFSKVVSMGYSPTLPGREQQCGALRCTFPCVAAVWEEWSESLLLCHVPGGKHLVEVWKWTWFVSYLLTMDPLFLK